MNDSQQLRESMWDLVYGLLSADESQALIARIKSDPDIARLYAEVQLQADLVSRAACVEDSSVVLSTSAIATPAATKQIAPKSTAVRSETRSTPADSHRGGAWLAGIGVTALVALLAVGFFWPQPSEMQLAQNFVAADVTVARPIQAGLTNKLAVHTYLVSSSSEPKEGTAASVDLRLVDRTGQERFHKAVITGENGQATVEIPGNALEPGIRLELASAPARHAGVAINPTADKAGIRDATKALQLGPNSVELPVEPEPQLNYFLVSEPNVNSDHSALFSVWSFAAFSATPDSLDPSLSVTSVLQGQANGATRMLADGLDTSGQLASALSKDKARMISSSEPVTVAIPPELAGKSLAVSATCRGVTVATTNVAEPTAAQASGGKATPSSDSISLALPPEADGLIEIAWFDRSLGESAPVHREQVYREPARRLQIDLPNVEERYAPGQEVELALRVTDERGTPAANTRLGVRVWNERVVRQSKEQPTLLADAARSGQGITGELGIELERFARRQGADLDAAAAPIRKSAVAESLQEEVQAATLAFTAPIELASNREAVQAAFRGAVDQAHTQRQRMMEIIGGAAIFGAITLLVLMGFLVVLRMSASIKAMTPALIAAAASLFVGLAWVGWLPQSNPKQIAMAPADFKSASMPTSSADDAPNELAGAAQPNAIVLRERAESAGVPTESAPARGPALATTPAAPPAAGQPADPSLGILRPESQRAGRVPALNEGVAPEADARTRGGESLNSLSRLNDEKKTELAASPAAIAPGAAGAFGAGGAATDNAQLAPKVQVRMRSAGETATKETRDDRTDNKSGAAAAPSALYFNPQLMTDANGLATVRFVMPHVDSEYRVLIDALGQGRIGSRQAMIVGSGTPQTAK